MKLYILRHGQADSSAKEDKDRELTDYGKAQCEIVGSWLRSQTPGICSVWSSPYLRATQTSEIISKKLNIKNPIKNLDSLTPCSHPLETIRDIENFDGQGLLLVSHMPLVGRLTHALISGHEDEPMLFQTCGLAKLEVVELKYQAAYLEWLIHPGILVLRD